MSRAGITAGLAGLLGIALAIGPASPGQASRAPVGDGPQLVRAAQPVPSVTKLAPQSGSTSGGFDVVIKGRNLADVKKVFFGATKATNVREKSARKLVVQAPAQAAGLVRVRVVTKHGGSKQSEATKFTYVTPAPALAQLSPRTGPTGGGTSVTITGRDLTGATSVRFGSSSVTTFRVTSPTTIVATSPARPVGPVNVSVTTAGGSATLDDAFAYAAPPRLDYVDPGSGPMASTPATLVGDELTADAQVTFDGVPATVLSASPDGTELVVNTPAHAAGFVNVAVTTAGGSATLANGYLFVAGTTLTAVTPSAGPASGLVNVTLTGSGFIGETLVTFGNKPSLDVVANLAGTQLTALLPPHAAGVVDVSVATMGGSATLAGAFTYVDAPTLTSLTPTVGPVAGGTAVTLTGTKLQAGMQVRFGGTLATLGSVNPEGNSATVTTPAHAPGAVDVSVATPGGTAALPGAFTYVAVPSVLAVAPHEGPATGGQTATLTGTGFRAGMQVSFGGTAAAGLVVVSPTEATVVTPAHPAGPVNVVVTTPGGTGPLATGYTYVDLPALTSVAPDNGPIGGGTTVTLTGSGFRAGMPVRFGGALAALVSVDPGGTSATAITPAHAAGTVDVTVTTPGGTGTATNGFNYVGSPALASVSPGEGPTTGGDTVTLTGLGFRAGMQVKFGGVPATGLVVGSATEATVTTPAHAAGVVDVSVSTTGGSGSLAGGYTFVIAPTLTAVAPDEGPATGGQSVTLSGTGLRDGMQVRLGGVVADMVSTNPGGTSATVITPGQAAGIVDVSVTTPGGAVTLTHGYTYVAAPLVDTISPDVGAANSPTMVTLTGVHLGSTTAVTFGGQAATIWTVSPTSVLVEAPALAVGTVDVVLTTVGGTASVPDGFTYVAAPHVTSISPTVGPVAGGTTVTIHGTALAHATAVSFGGTPAAGFTVVDDNTVTAQTPAHAAGSVLVLVVTPGGQVGNANAFTYVAAPMLTAVAPDTGPAAGGTTVTLTGTGLTGTTDVTFGGVPATGVLVVDDTTVTAVAPAHPAGVVDVSLGTPFGSVTLAAGFAYLP